MMPFPPPPRPSATAPRTILSESRAEVAAALLEHLQDPEAVTELLDFAGLNGDGECLRARVSYDRKTETWLLDLYGSRREAAA